MRIGVHTRVIAYFDRRAAGDGVAVSGAVLPRHVGRTVRLERRTQAGWRTFATTRLDSRSRFTFAWKPAARPHVSVMRVLFPAHSDHLAGASPSLTVRVHVR